MRTHTRMLAALFVLVLSSADRESLAADGRYCGLYATHGALHALGLKPDFEEMVSTTFLSGEEGRSTANDLVRLAQKYGATARYRTRMNWADLRACESPVVLHMSVPSSPSAYHHWTLFLGMDGDSARIYDPPRGTYTLSSAELLSQWDGTGVVMNHPDAHRLAMSWPDLETACAVLIVLLIGLAVVPFRVVGRYPTVALAGVAVVSALCWHAVIDQGFLHNRLSLGVVAAKYEEQPVPLTDVAHVREATGRTGVTIVDARTPESFARTRIPGAVNVPITSTHGSLRDALAAIPTDNEVIVYCQSDGCRWADSIARQFSARGYRRVFVFRGGMEEWKASNKHTSATPNKGGRG